MRCEDVRRQLVYYRELSSEERDRVRQHCADCGRCAALLADYEQQDVALSRLPVSAPSSRLSRRVLAATTRSQSRPRATTQRVGSVLAICVLMLVVALGGTFGAAAQALPGEPLYPVKRVGEQVRLTLTLSDAARERYQSALRARRLEEVRDVAVLPRQTEVHFEGRLESVADGSWTIDGIEVQIAPQAWGLEPPPSGAIISFVATAGGGQVLASEVRLSERREPEASEDRPSPTATADRVIVAPSKAPAATDAPTELPKMAASPTSLESRPPRDRTLQTLWATPLQEQPYPDALVRTPTLRESSNEVPLSRTPTQWVEDAGVTATPQEPSRSVPPTRMPTPRVNEVRPTATPTRRAAIGPIATKRPEKPPTTVPTPALPIRLATRRASAPTRVPAESSDAETLPKTNLPNLPTRTAVPVRPTRVPATSEPPAPPTTSPADNAESVDAQPTPRPLNSLPTRSISPTRVSTEARLDPTDAPAQPSW